MLNTSEFRLDVQDLVRSIELSAVVLDRDLHVRFMTASAARLIQVEDAMLGRAVSDIPGLMAQAHLIDDVRNVLTGGRTIERLVLCLSGHSAMRRSQPYRTQGRSVEGVVITLLRREGCCVHDAFSDPIPSSTGAGDSACAPHPVMSRLTVRQREIMDLVLAGHPSKKIAAELGISSRTVENHRASIMHRTGCRSLPELTRFALRATSGLSWS